MSSGSLYGVARDEPGRVSGAEPTPPDRPWLARLGPAAMVSARPGSIAARGSGTCRGPILVQCRAVRGIPSRPAAPDGVADVHGDRNRSLVGIDGFAGQLVIGQSD